MRRVYVKCKKCGRELHKSKWTWHLARDHGFASDELPTRRLAKLCDELSSLSMDVRARAWSSYLSVAQELLREADELFAEWFDELGEGDGDEG